MRRNKTSIGKIESFTKAVGHRTRLKILLFLFDKSESTLEEIRKHINSTQQNTSNHVNKMLYGGVVMKKQKGNFVLHKLTKKGEKFVKFIERNFE